MPIRSDIYQYITDYRGILGWNSFTEVYTGQSRLHIEIPIYVKDMSVPTRPLKMTETSTIQTTDPGTGMSTTSNITFFGAPDILQQTVTGWTITPLSNGVWAPVSVSGTALNYGQLSYNNIISYYIAGRFNRGSKGQWQRKDPDYWITPRGHYYTNPYIAQWNPQDQQVQKKQAFDMTLYLEA